MTGGRPVFLYEVYRVRFSIAVRETFNASHSTQVCGHGLHGHTFEAEVEMAGDPSPEGNVGSYVELSARLRAILAEADGRDLHDMLFPELPEQLCVYLRERLAMSVPNIIRVCVRAGSISAMVEFPLR